MNKSLVLILLFLVSCNNKQQKTLYEENIVIPNKTQFFQTAFFEDKPFYQLSFPNWFNRKVIADNDIYRLEIIRENNEEEKLDQFDFYFHEQGWIQRISYNNAVNAVINVERSFSYKSSDTILGFYRKVNEKHVKQPKFNKFPGQIENDNVFSIYNILSIDENHLIFESQQSSPKKHLIYFTDAKNWNVLNADLFLPKYENITFIYGTPEQPHQSFQLQNLVEKNNWKKYEYYQDSKLLKEIFTSQNHSFYQQDFFYDSTGVLSFWEKSSYDLDTNIMQLEVFEINYLDKANIPAFIKVSSGINNDVTKLKEIWRFKYYFNDGN